MNQGFSNVYGDAERADAYAGLEFPGTYWLAFRDIPELVARHVGGAMAGPDGDAGLPSRRGLDFGCGAGRSSRFLRGLGFDVVGADISEAMLERARRADPGGDYRLVADGDLVGIAGERFDVVLSAFTFDNVPGFERKAALFGQLGDLLAPGGRIVNLVSAADIYLHEWTSFSTKDFPENRTARPGDVVRIVMLDVPDRRPVDDIFWPDEAYRDVYREAGLSVRELHRPLGRPGEPSVWMTETEVSPWAIWVLGRESEA